jgi:hypothetical protein
MGEAATELWLVDPFTLAYLAGHSDILITKRYVHPEDETVRGSNGSRCGRARESPQYSPTVPQRELKAACAVVASV